MEIFPLLLFMAFAAVMLVVSWSQHENHQAAMKQLAIKSGFSLSGEKVIGSVGTASVEIDVHKTGSGKNSRTWTRFRVQDPQALRAHQIAAEGLFSGMGRLLGTDDIQLGDPEADGKLLLRGEADELLAFIDADARGMLRRAVVGGWEHEAGVWEYRRSGKMTNVEEMHRIVRQGLAVVAATQRTDSVDNTLVRRALTDPLASAAARCLEERMKSRNPLDASEKAQLLAAGGEVAVMMAASMGTEGVPTLRQALQTGGRGQRIRAALALANVGEGGATVEATLVQVLKTDVADLAIAALEQVGTVNSVGALRPLADEWLGNHRHTAQKAIRAIQARVVGAEAGQVSVVGAVGGEVSVVDAQRAVGAPRQTEG